MAALFYEDVEAGHRFMVPGRTVFDVDIALFAMVSGDFHPIHTNDAYAASSQFGRRIAHGAFGVALAVALFGRIPEFLESAIALTEIREWVFRSPVFVGDTLDLHMEIAGKRLSRSGRGLVDRRMQLRKRDGSIAQEGIMGLLIARRS